MKKIYSSNGRVYFWDWVDTTYSSSQQIAFEIQKVEQNGTIDIVTSEDGDVYLSSGYDTPLLSKRINSKRLEDNTSVVSKLNFDNAYTVNKSIAVNRGDYYMISNDTKKGIYKYGAIVQGFAPSFHKIITTNSSSVQLDNIYSLFFHAPSGRLYFSHTVWAVHAVSYIDTQSLAKEKYWYLITDVFSSQTIYNKKIVGLRIWYSNTSGNNYLKLYKRINNGSWELIRTYNEASNTIRRDNIKSETKEFIDIQYKVELYNDTRGENAPELHELSFDYDIIQV